jgi:hypothetical protein
VHKYWSFIGNYEFDWRNSKPRTKLKKTCECYGWNWSNQCQIKEIESLFVYCESKYTNSEPKTKMKKTINFRANNWVWHGWNLQEIKSWEAIMGVIKRN